MRRPRYIRPDIMHEKARKLVESRRVEFLGNGVYNIIGDHGTYTVSIDYQGKISCNCPGYLTKGICSHGTAVEMLKHRR